MKKEKKSKPETAVKSKKIYIAIIIISLIAITVGIVLILSQRDSCESSQNAYQYPDIVEAFTLYENSKYNTSTIIETRFKEDFITSYNQIEHLITIFGPIDLSIPNNTFTSITDYFNEDFFLNHNLAYFAETHFEESNYTDVTDIEYSKDSDTIILQDNTPSYIRGGKSSPYIRLVFIPVKKNSSNINFKIRPYINDDNDGIISMKPIIYIYPEEETNLSVTVGYPEKFTCVYPEYNNGWNVLAKPDGTLIDTTTNKEYYSLYYECDNSKDYSNYDFSDGFVVRKENITSFLEEKLSILGLNAKESQEFIIYWLPKMQDYEYSFIRFQTLEEIEENMPLYFSEDPDTLIRVFMEWKGLDEPIKTNGQTLEPVTRDGFTIVEWGGTVLD